MPDDLMKRINNLSPENRVQVARFVDFLEFRSEQSQNKTRGERWTFDLIEYFHTASISPKDPKSGAEIKIDAAKVGGESRPAIYAHPPVSQAGSIEYFVPVPEKLVEATLRVSIGIRDGSKLASPNMVAFSIHLNGYRIWGTQTHRREWQSFTVPVNFRAGDVNRLRFSTQALGNHQWTWAVWGEPHITGRVHF